MNATAIFRPSSAENTYSSSKLKRYLADTISTATFSTKLSVFCRAKPPTIRNIRMLKMVPEYVAYSDLPLEFKLILKCSLNWSKFSSP